jgi:hypothetical protein
MLNLLVKVIPRLTGSGSPSFAFGQTFLLETMRYFIKVVGARWWFASHSIDLILGGSARVSFYWLI